MIGYYILTPMEIHLGSNPQVIHSLIVKATATAAKVMAETASSITWNKSGVKQGIATTHLSLFFCVLYLLK